MPVPPQLAILAELDAPRTARELSERTRWPYHAIYKAIQELCRKGILTSHRQGRDLIVQPASSIIPDLARTLAIDFPRQDWKRVFLGDRPVVLHVLDRVGAAKPTAQVCGKTPQAVHHVIRILGPRGIVTTSEGRYVINPRYRALRSLLEEMAKAYAQKQLKDVAPAGRMLWRLGPEILFKSDSRIEHQKAHLAALSAFADCGVPLVTDHHYYYLSNRKLDVSDAILQGLLVEPESRVNRSYSALVYEKHRPKDLAAKSRIYGLEAEVDALIRYVELRKTNGDFLPWDEHKQYRQLYGVEA